MGTVDWVRVTRAHPCPVCGRTHYCSVSADGGLVFCTRTESDRPSRNGDVPGWLHKAGPARTVNGHGSRNGHAAVVARTTYEIRDVAGLLVANHVRRDLADGDKLVHWELPDGTKGLAGRKLETLPLYALDVLDDLRAGSTVFVCEGEKATDALRGLDLPAVGTATGADTIPDEENLRVLVGYDVVLWPDNDEKGRRHMQRIADRLARLHVEPRILTWPDAPEKGDAADFVAAGLGKDELRRLYAEAVVATLDVAAATPDVAEAESFDDLHLTDMGNAERLVKRHGPDLRYCVRWKRWVVWTGEAWAAEGDELVQERTKEMVLAIYEEGIAAGSPERAAAVWKHAQRSEAAGRIHAAIDLARSTRSLLIAPDDLDRDPMLLNCANGTVELGTGTLRAFCREDLMSKRSPVVFDADARCPTWIAFLEEIMLGDRGMVDYLQRVAGYCLTGLTIERVMFILFGAGRNGKSTFLEVLRYVLGDYASGTPASTIMSQRNKGIPNDIARLKGARFVSASETSEGAEIDEAFVKVATGGDTITARFLNAEFFDFRPQFKILLSTNHKPSIKGTDPAVWDRIHLTPFLFRIPDDQVDKGLRDRLLAEADGILQWAIAGCLAWQRIGLAPPSKVLEATDEYRLDEDVLKLFIEDCCLEQPHVNCTTGDLYEAFKEWAERHGEEMLSQTKFGRRIRERGFRQTRIGSVRGWSGIQLLVKQRRDKQPDGL
jgi:putative DNA primase/helicase